MSDTRTPGADDATIEAAVLQQLLALHPVQLSREDLAREVSDEPERFAARDAVERAVRELTAAGLVHRGGDVVLPSRAALRFEELLG